MHKTDEKTIEDIKRLNAQGIPKNKIVELYFNVFAEQLHKHFGFGSQRIMKLWRCVDARIGDIAQGSTTKEELEKELEKEIGTICRFRE